jgi:hypothetical protein
MLGYDIINYDIILSGMRPGSIEKTTTKLASTWLFTRTLKLQEIVWENHLKN